MKNCKWYVYWISLDENDGDYEYRYCDNPKRKEDYCDSWWDFNECELYKYEEE